MTTHNHEIHFPTLSEHEIKKHLSDIHRVRELLEQTLWDARTETPSIVDSSRMLMAINTTAYAKSLQQGGYSVIVTYPQTSALAAGNYPLSIFNNGGKTLVIESIQVTSFVAGQVLPFQVNYTNADPVYALRATVSNHKVGLANAPAMSATYAITSQAIPANPPPALFGSAPAQNTVEVLTNDHIFILPAKTGLTIWVIPGAGSASIAINADVLEYPF